MPTTLRSVRNGCGVALVVVAASMTGCATQGRPPAASVPPPTLQLLSSEPLQLPKGCDVRGGVVYRTSYVVQGDGHVTDMRSQPGPACLQAALTGWVGSFQYAAPGEPVPTVLDWMVVTARRAR